jgi:hypothetical protein
MYKTIVTIWSEQRIPNDIDLVALAHSVDNGDEISLGNIKCFKKDDYEADPDFSSLSRWWDEDD